MLLHVRHHAAPGPLRKGEISPRARLPGLHREQSAPRVQEGCAPPCRTGANRFEDLALDAHASLPNGTQTDFAYRFRFRSRLRPSRAHGHRLSCPPGLAGPKQSLPLGLVETRTASRVSDRQASRGAPLRVLGRRPGLVGSPRNGCRWSSLAEGTDDARLSAACSTKHAGTCAFVDRSPLCRSLSPTPRRSPSSRFCQPARPGPSPTSRFCHVARPRRPPTTPEARLFRSLSVTDRATCAPLRRWSVTDVSTCACFGTLMSRRLRSMAKATKTDLCSPLAIATTELYLTVPRTIVSTSRLW